MIGLSRHCSSSIIFLLVTVWLPSQVTARGRMMEPPQRSSLFSRGFNSPRNDDDSALNCGGPWRQHELNGGKCGVCGDSYDAIVRENEAGGKFANGIIANTYTTNDSSVPVVIDIQSFLKGYFEFRICPHNNVAVPVEQSCLDRHALRVWDFEDNHPRYQYFPKGVGLQRLRVELPSGMTCSQCVLQWKWQTGNNWGRCSDGLYRVGCGPQETYINCADVAIVPANDLEYGHFLPEIPNVHAPFPATATANNARIGSNNNPADAGVMPWASVSFVSHDSKTVVELRNTSDPTDPPLVSNYDTETGSIHSAPGSFLPKEAIEVLPEEPVQPKFDFYDPSTVVNEVKIPATRTEPIVPLDLDQITTIDTSQSVKTKKDIVVLPFNGVSRQTLDDSTVLGLATNPSIMDSSLFQDSVTDTTGITTESATTGGINNGMVTTSTEPKPTQPSIMASSIEPKPTIPSTAASFTADTTKQATTRNFDIRTFTGINMTTPNVAENLEISTPLNTKPAKVQITTTDANGTVQGTTETPVAIAEETLSRHTRQAGSMVPPPPPAATGPGSSGVAPMAPGPNTIPSPSGMYDPAQPAQDNMMIQQQQQQYSSGNTMSGSVSVTSNLGQQIMGVEALGESRGTSHGAAGLQGNAAANPSFPGAAAQYNQQQADPGQPGQGMSSVLLQDPRMGPMSGGAGLGPSVAGDPSADQGVPYQQPRIPRPPEVSAREIEAAIADTPIISSAVSDTGKPMDASSILGTSYIPGLNEAASNLAETSTASRQGTMIVHAELTSPADRGKKGGSVEYLSPTQGTSMSDKPSETQAQIPEAKFSQSLGFMPTPEQIMSGMRGMARPVPADTTSLEPTGPDPNVQNVQEAKEALINQLGAAMGILPGSGQQPVPASPPAQAANLVPDQNIATVLAMAGLSGQTSAGPIATSAETMATNQMQQPSQTMQMGQSATFTSDATQSNAASQSVNEQSLLSQTGGMSAVQGTKAIPGLMGRLTGQMGNMSPELLQLLAQAQTSGIDPRMMLAGFNQGLAELSIAPGMAIQGADGSLNIKMKESSGTQIQTQASTEGGTIMTADAQTGRIPMGPDMMIPGPKAPMSPAGPDMILPPSKMAAPNQGAADPSIPYGQNTMIYEAGSPVPGPRTPVGKDAMSPPSAEASGPSQQPPTQMFAQTAITEKAPDVPTLGANMVMDQTMMENLMRMRPEMMKYLKIGAQAGSGGGMTSLEDLFKQNMGMHQSVGNQQANAGAMTSSNQGAASRIDMKDMARSSGLLEINQPQVEKSAISQEFISNPVDMQNAQVQSGTVRQQSISGDQAMAEMQLQSTGQKSMTGEQGISQLNSGRTGQQQGMTQEQAIAQMQSGMTGQQQGVTAEQAIAQMQLGMAGQQGVPGEQAMAEMQLQVTGQESMTGEQQIREGMTGQQGMTREQGVFGLQSGRTGQQQGMTQERAMAQMQSEMTGQEGMTREQGMSGMLSGMTGQQRGIPGDQAMAQMQLQMKGQEGMTREQQMKAGITGQQGMTQEQAMNQMQSILAGQNTMPGDQTVRGMLARMTGHGQQHGISGNQAMAQMQSGIMGQQQGMAGDQAMAQMQLRMTGQDSMTGEQQIKSGMTGQQGMTQEQAMNQMQSEMAGQQTVNIASGQTIQQEPGPSATQANNLQSDVMLNVGKLFEGNTELIGSGIMAGTAKSDLSGVQYETANKVAGVNQVGVNQGSSVSPRQPDTVSGQTATGQISVGVQTSATEQASATTDAVFGQGSAFAGVNNQQMGQFGFGSMSQAGDMGAVMSEVVSGPGQTITAQEVEPGTSGVYVGAVDTSASAQSPMDIAAQTTGDVKATADFTPIGSIGSLQSVSGVGSSSPVAEQQWSWDPITQSWVLVAASDIQPQSQATDSMVTNQIQARSAVELATSSQAQSQTDMAASQGAVDIETLDQQGMATDVTALNQQATGLSQSQGNQFSAGDQAMGQSGRASQTNFEGYQWDAATNSYIPVQSPEQVQAQGSAAVNQVTDVQTGIAQGATGDITAGIQQFDSQAQAQVRTDSMSQSAGTSAVAASGQQTGQVGQSWEQAGYQWDAETNAYVPTGTLKQSVVKSSQIGATSAAAAVVDQAPVQTVEGVGSSALDISASGNMQMTGSVDMSVGGAAEMPVVQQIPNQARTTLYEQQNQVVSQPVTMVTEPKTTLYQAPDQGITHQDTRLDMSGSQYVDKSITAEITSSQQQGQAAVPAQLMTQQGFQQQQPQQGQGLQQQVTEQGFMQQAEQQAAQQVANQAAQQGFQQQSAQPGFQQVDFTQWGQQQQQAEGRMQGNQQQTGSLSAQGTIQTSQTQSHGQQDAGFESMQQTDMSQRSSTFDMSAQQALSAEERSKGFQQGPQLPTQSSTGPLMVETQPWEQQGTSTQQQQRGGTEILLQMGTTGTSSGRVSQTSQQMDSTGMGQASQQQWDQSSVQGSAGVQVGQQVSQQVDVSGMMQGSAQQQPTQDSAQMAQNAQLQQWQAAQTMNAQSPQYQAALSGQTSAGPVVGMANQQGQISAGSVAISAGAMTAGQMQQAGATATQATGMQTWNQNTQTQMGVQGTQTGVQGTQTGAQGIQTGVQGSQTATTGTQMDTSFTPIGQIGSGYDATATAWQALLAAAQAEAQVPAGTPTQAATPIVAGQGPTQQAPQYFAQQLANQQAAAQKAAAQQSAAQQTAAQQAAAQQQHTVSWEEILKAAMAHQAETAKQQQTAQTQQARPQVPAWATGLQTQQSSQSQQSSTTQVVQQQTAAAKPSPPQRPGAEPQRKIPIRPDPVTRAKVRDMFVSQMSQGPDVDPLHILIGLSPEMLMKSGVNPRIARSGDVSKIVPAVERALGISLRRRRGRGGRRGGGPRSGIGGSFADPMGGPGAPGFGGIGPEPMGSRGRRPQSARDRAMQRRKFMMEQRMISEVMNLFGLGPEPLEPGDPGYRAPGQRGAGGGAAARMGGMSPMTAGGPGMGAAGPGGAVAGNPQSRMMMELLGM